MNAQVATMVLGLALSQGSKRFDLERPEVLWPLRALYVSVQLIQLAMYLYIASKVSLHSALAPTRTSKQADRS